MIYEFNKTWRSDEVEEIVKFNSELLHILANVLKAVALLFGINHVIACAWFFVADEQTGKEETWITHHGFANDSWVYVYTTALHW